MKERLNKDTKGWQAGTHHPHVAFKRGPDHDGDVVPSRIVPGDGGTRVNTDDTYSGRTMLG